MLRSLLVFSVIFFTFLITPIRAQDDPDALVVRASRLIDSTMSAINLRAQRFNEELAKINAAEPMKTSSLDSVHIPKNLEKIKDFLNYLDVYRSLSKKLKQDVEDSVEALRQKMSPHHRAAFMQEFLDAYNLDQGAFDKYTLALTKVFTDMSAVLVFVRKSNVAIKDNKLEFTSKHVMDEYNELIAAVEKNNKKLINASANSQKATIDASSLMQKAYGSLRK